MKKIFFVLVCALTTFAFLSSASAIDRNRKSKDSDKKEKTTEIKEMTKDKAEAQKKSRAAALKGKTVRSDQSKSAVRFQKPEKGKKGTPAKGSSERYDYFQDSDNDGVNDRLQKKKMKERAQTKEAVKKKSPAPEKKEMPARVVPSPKKPEKAERTKAEEPKKQSRVKEPAKKKEARDRR